MPRAASGVYSADLLLMVKGLHEYADRQPAGHPMRAAMGAADKGV